MRFQFIHEYYKKNKLNDFLHSIFITITEQPSFNIKEEDYSLRLETCHGKDIHRKYSIEHHLTQRHNKPHLQFKFNSERIGAIWINLFFENESEYKKGIEGFIFYSKNIFKELEVEHEKLCNEMMYVDKVDSLIDQGKFLHKKITTSIQEGLIEFNNCIDKDKKELIESHSLLKMFIGENNIKLLLNNIK